MTKVWRIVIAVVLAVLALGVLLGGAGLLTGASWSRVWDPLSENLNALRAQLAPYHADLLSWLGI